MIPIEPATTSKNCNQPSRSEWEGHNYRVQKEKVVKIFHVHICSRENFTFSLTVPRKARHREYFFSLTHVGVCVCKKRFNAICFLENGMSDDYSIIRKKGKSLY